MTTESKPSVPTLANAERFLRFSLFAFVLLAGCGVRTVDPDSLPPDLRSSYALFEVRCSKCHTIARPLNAPIRDATHWELYVTRMRRVPGSGIDERDAREILRFLTYYTEVIRGGQHGGTDTSGGATVETAEPPTESEEEQSVPEETSAPPPEAPLAPAESVNPDAAQGGLDAASE